MGEGCIMSVKIGICDDCAEDIRLLSDALHAYDASFKITTYTDGESLLEDAAEHKILFDILFLDIYMPGINGIEAGAKIRAEMKDLTIIFVSSSVEYYPEAFEIFAFSYLLKPINPNKLNHVMDHALAAFAKDRRRNINFSYKGTTYRISCRNILYLESTDKIITFYMADHFALQCYSKLDDILEELPEDSFVRCHQSFAVNVFYVTEMTDSHFRIDSKIISISKKYQKSAKDKYYAYLFMNMNRGR